jgi:hypothetical protein
MMDLYFRFIAWLNYAAVEFGSAEVEEEKAEAMVKKLQAMHMVLNWGAAKDKVTLARAQQAVDPEISRAMDEQLAAYARRKMAQIVYENCERSAAALSRELSRRLGRYPLERREMRWST